MKVLMLIRKEAFTQLGGDTIQLMRTRTWLERMGVTVRVRTGLPTGRELAWADLFHLFNITDVGDTLPQVRLTRETGKPIALSTIYWNGDEYVFEARTLVTRRLQVMRRLLGRETTFHLWKPVYRREQWQLHRNQQEILLAADLLLPNSEAERQLLLLDFRLPNEKQFAVVPNGVDTPRRTSNFFQRQYGLTDFVLCAGRIEDRKNQHRLIEAIAPLGIPLVLIGPPNPTQPHYYQLCRTVAGTLGANVTFIPEYWDQERLFSAYTAARVHVLVSWYDTPGLSSLEAAAAGCNIVSTDRGPTKEYFDSLAWYADPGSIASIRDALAAAFYGPRQGEQLRERIHAHFTWEGAARTTLAAYEGLLGVPHREPRHRGRASADENAGRIAGR